MLHDVDDGSVHGASSGRTVNMSATFTSLSNSDKTNSKMRASPAQRRVQLARHLLSVDGTWARGALLISRKVLRLC